VNGDVLRLAVEVFLSQADKRDMLADLSLPLHPDNIPPPVLNQNIQVELHCGLDFDQSIPSSIAPAEIYILSVLERNANFEEGIILSQKKRIAIFWTNIFISHCRLSSYLNEICTQQA
jgi:hypothetical protein